jgi:hypothetical protein
LRAVEVGQAALFATWNVAPGKQVPATELLARQDVKLEQVARLPYCRELSGQRSSAPFADAATIFDKLTCTQGTRLRDKGEGMQAG